MQPAVPPASHEVMAADRPVVYYLLTGAILTLAGVIAVLWRRGERSRDRALKAAEEAREQLGDAVSVYLDGGTAATAVASTIVDVTGEVPTILREGAISAEAISEVLDVDVEQLRGVS